MKAFVPQITAVLLVLHAVLGCCWHHGHMDRPACDGVCESIHVEQAGDSPVCEHSHAQAKCLGVACVYTADSKRVADRASLSSDVLPTADRLATQFTVSCNGGGLPSFAASFFLPVPLHLAHQALLI